MFLRRVIILSAATLFLSGCAIFSSDEAEVRQETVADEDVTETNVTETNVTETNATETNVTETNVAVVVVAPPPPPPVRTVRNTVTSLHVADRPSPNFDRRTLPVSLIVLHYTAAPLKESLNALRDSRGNARVSSHYLISQNGTIFRLVDEKNRAWHAGVSRWKGITDVNSASIGIEMVNLGHDRFGRARPFTAAQVEAVTKLCLDIQSRHDITDVVGHSDVAPMRKIDPGELFPWKKLASRGVKVSTKGFTRKGVAR